jgi:hypothetical protein
MSTLIYQFQFTNYLPSPKNIVKWPKLAWGRSNKAYYYLAMGSIKGPVYTIPARLDEAVSKILTIISTHVQKYMYIFDELTHEHVN